MEEPARSQPLAPVSGVPSSCPSGPSESEMLRKLREFAPENPWANRGLANPELVPQRLQGYDGAEDTPPATHINRDEHSVSAPSASAAGRHLSTLERTIEHPSPTTDLPPSTANVAPTQPAASVTPPAHRSSVERTEHTSENSPSVPEIRHFLKTSLGSKMRFLGFGMNSFFIFTPTTALHALCDFL